MNFIIIPIVVIVAALMDGYQHSGKKLFASFWKSLFIGGIGYFILADGAWYYVVYFVLCWWIFFDIVYNIVRWQKLFYVGSTKWTDKLIRWAFRTNASHFSFITKLMALVLCIGLIYRYG